MSNNSSTSTKCDLERRSADCDLHTFARLSARIECPGTCANDLKIYNSVEEAMLGAVVAIEEFYPETSCLNPLQMHIVLCHYRALVFPTCNPAMSEAQYTILSG